VSWSCNKPKIIVGYFINQPTEIWGRLQYVFQIKWFACLSASFHAVIRFFKNIIVWLHCCLCVVAIGRLVIWTPWNQVHLTLWLTAPCRMVQFDTVVSLVLSYVCLSDVDAVCLLCPMPRVCSAYSANCLSARHYATHSSVTLFFASTYLLYLFDSIRIWIPFLRKQSFIYFQTLRASCLRFFWRIQLYINHTVLWILY